ncbi:MAG TPA: hypothetical protein VF615_15530 [Longimicrobiaceae bacterium]|jgi:hypothetical protein
MNAPTVAAASLALALGAALLPSHLAAQRHSSPRDAVVDARGATRLRVDALAGSLRIEGRPGLREVRIRGVARANDRKYLDAMRLAADRSGSEVRVAVEIPEVRVLLGRVQRVLDLVIEVPEGMAVDVDDSSGETEIRRVGALRVKDSSGELVIEDVRGDLDVTDSSGGVSIAQVAGGVRVTDSSGELRIRDVRGAVVVDEDSSGEIDVRDVRGDVLVREDGSGGIRVDGVGGNLTVRDDGSGGVRVGRVAGTVRVPRR